jgi:ParB family chromosome partitioning protein
MVASDREALELALIENLQRRDLTPFEEAEGYRTLAEKYGYTHEQVSTAVGKSRSTVTESLKLLAIPPAIRDLCRHADITAKSVLLLIARAETIEEMERLVQEIAEGNLDREAARATASEGKGATSGTDTPGSDDVGGASARYKPQVIRLRPTPNSPIRISLSIRQAGVSKADVIATLQAVIEQLRSGELDDRLRPPENPPTAPAKHKA